MNTNTNISLFNLTQVFMVQLLQTEFGFGMSSVSWRYNTYNIKTNPN